MRYYVYFLLWLGFVGNVQGAKAGPKIQFSTNMGSFTVELNEKKAPKTVKNFLGYVKKGFYNNTSFHRVIKNFMVQGGGFELQEGKLIQKKTESPVKNEADNGLKNERGAIAMARTSDPDSATSQFFINVVDNHRLNYVNKASMGYTVFGKVIKGMDVVDKIRAVPTGQMTVTTLSPSGGYSDAPFRDVPKKTVVIKKARVIR